MRRTTTFLLLLLCGSSTAAVLIRAAQKTDTPRYDIAFTSSRDGRIGI